MWLDQSLPWLGDLLGLCMTTWPSALITQGQCYSRPDRQVGEIWWASSGWILALSPYLETLKSHLCSRRRQQGWPGRARTMVLTDWLPRSRALEYSTPMQTHSWRSVDYCYYTKVSSNPLSHINEKLMAPNPLSSYLSGFVEMFQWFSWSAIQTLHPAPRLLLYVLRMVSVFLSDWEKSKGE